MCCFYFCLADVVDLLFICCLFCGWLLLLIVVVLAHFFVAAAVAPVLLFWFFGFCSCLFVFLWLRLTPHKKNISLQFQRFFRLSLPKPLSSTSFFLLSLFFLLLILLICLLLFVVLLLIMIIIIIFFACFFFCFFLLCCFFFGLLLLWLFSCSSCSCSASSYYSAVSSSSYFYYSWVLWCMFFLTYLIILLILLLLLSTLSPLVLALVLLRLLCAAILAALLLLVSVGGLLCQARCSRGASATSPCCIFLVSLLLLIPLEHGSAVRSTAAMQNKDLSWPASISIKVRPSSIHASNWQCLLFERNLSEKVQAMLLMLGPRGIIFLNAVCGRILWCFCCELQCCCVEVLMVIPSCTDLLVMVRLRSIAASIDSILLQFRDWKLTWHVTFEWGIRADHITKCGQCSKGIGIA